MRIGTICKKHGFIRGEFCDKCAQESPKNTLYITTYDWVKKGVWEHIDPHNSNLRFNSKSELINYCKRISNEERDVIPKAFMKPKSQGKGYTWKE